MAMMAFAKRKSINIGGSAGAGTGYTLLLKVGESAAASPCDFFVNTRYFPWAKSARTDLQFTSGDGNVALPYWVEKVTGSAPNRVAWIWVRVSDDLSVAQTIYCTYCDPELTTAANGAAVFELFDDFDGTALDPTLWQTSSGAPVSVFGSLLTLSGMGAYHWVASQATIADGKEVIGQFSSFPFSLLGYVTYYGWLDTPAGTAGTKLVNSWDYSAVTSLSLGTESNAAAGQFSPRASGNARVQVRRNAGAAEAIIDGAFKKSRSGASSAAAYLSLMRVYEVSGVLDWVVVRRYVSVEPSVTSVGLEETGSLSQSQPSLIRTGGQDLHVSVTKIAPKRQYTGMRALMPSTTRADNSVGPGSVLGTVKVDTLPVSRKVRLFDVATGRLLKETWSDKAGVYRFDGLALDRPYTVLSHDHLRDYNATVADYVYAEVLP